MRCKFIILFVAMWLVAGKELAYADCVRKSEGAERNGTSEFFRTTRFGTIGFSVDGSSEIYAINDHINCISLPQPNIGLTIYMNHRNSATDDVGYVSFMLFGITQSPPRQFSRYLRRTGSWMRDGAALEDFPSKSAQLPDANVISSYEDFYIPHSVKDLAAFDGAFGKLHGAPQASDENSWDERESMSPDSDAVYMPNVGYLRHELQRIEVRRNVTSTNNPPNVEFDRFQYPVLVVAVHSPLNDGVDQTVRFEFH
jgi:hypothetical protein